MRKNGIVNKYEYVKEKITMDNKEKALLCHKEWNGKLETVAKSKVKTREDLAIAYTPGVAEPCKVIAEDKTAAYTYTWKANTVAVVSDGSAVLGLGNIGPYAAMPVMEGKCVLFKEFGNVNAVPICLDTQDTEEIIQAVKNIAPGFGGINLEDISAPRCFEIEERLKEMLDIPVFHDDQHGTAIIACAAVLGALRFAKKDITKVKVVVNGCGAAGSAIGKLLYRLGVTDLTMIDIDGAVYEGRPGDMDMATKYLASVTNKAHYKGNLAGAAKGADVLIGVSGPRLFTKDIMESMAPKAVVFALANPVPETTYEEAKAAGADYVGLDEYINKIKGGWTDIDVIITMPSIMGKIGALGRVLGPRGLMPNPKSGTVTNEIGNAVKEVKQGKIDFKVDKSGIVHTSVGKVSFTPEQIRDNAKEFISTLIKLKPTAAKGAYIKSIYLSSTMSAGIKIDPKSVEEN